MAGPLTGYRIIEIAGIGPGPMPAILMVVYPVSGPAMVPCSCGWYSETRAVSLVPSGL